MEVTRICLLVAILLSGCAQDSQIEPAAPSKPIEQVTYHDRNGDGKVDQETHRYPNMADADWELVDNDYDGKYEKKIHYGVGIFETSVDSPVPASVPIEKKP